MKEEFQLKSVETSNAKQQQAKQQLLLAQLSVHAFLERISELDQLDPSRSEAIHNIDLLTDPVIAAIVTKDTEDQFEYYNLLSLSHFHVGQQLLIDRPEVALTHLEAALEKAEHINEKDYADYNGWKLYIRATIAYCKKDTQGLKAIYTEMEDSQNKNIVGNLLRGLTEYSDIDYRRDYRNTKKSDL